MIRSEKTRIRGGREALMDLQQMVQGVLPGLGEELLLNVDERSFSETLQTDHHPWNTTAKRTLLHRTEPISKDGTEPGRTIG